MIDLLTEILPWLVLVTTVLVAMLLFGSAEVAHRRSEQAAGDEREP